MCVTDPDMCTRTTLRYAFVQTALCSQIGRRSWTFYRAPKAATSRTLFRYSLVYLPALMLLMIVGSYARGHTYDKMAHETMSTRARR